MGSRCELDIKPTGHFNNLLEVVMKKMLFLIVFTGVLLSSCGEIHCDDPIYESRQEEVFVNKGVELAKIFPNYEFGSFREDEMPREVASSKEGDIKYLTCRSEVVFSIRRTKKAEGMDKLGVKMGIDMLKMMVKSSNGEFTSWGDGKVIAITMPVDVSIQYKTKEKIDKISMKFSETE